MVVRRVDPAIRNLVVDHGRPAESALTGLLVLAARSVGQPRLPLLPGSASVFRPHPGPSGRDRHVCALSEPAVGDTFGPWLSSAV